MAVARNLTDASIGLRWSADDLRDLVARLGWKWAGEVDGGIRLTCGLPGGDAMLVPVNARARAWAPSQEFLELVVPVSRPAAEVPAQVDEFRRAADAVRQVLGDATYLGAHGLTCPSGYRLDPPGESPSCAGARAR
ncbi:hypothetical protein F7Q99_27335 [Streptomyces kaniharaensis]|uniref:Uncharacterized protein n=1 Tax=Streptomyces kaniharaensis TaxID=212423 RepID=A0A6N7L268_9ACTN|nr:hypothetical protein [Streptomyces kaniharaensis]MQS15873.1 hypothetical protein [Streptomyces kaniharaensis]